MNLGPGLQHAAFASLSAIFVAIASPALADESVRVAHYAMGTLLEITVDAPDRTTGLARIRRATRRVEQLEQRLSNWLESSDVEALNARAGAPAAPVDADLFAVLGQARSLSVATGGAFDVTAGTWFPPPGGREDARGDIDAVDRDTLRNASGVGNLLLLPGRRAALGSSWTRADLGGIAKGYALRLAADELRRAGVTRALLNFGRSSMLALGSGHPPIGIESGGALAGSLALADLALSSSESLTVHGDGSEAAPHIVDPRTGLWITAERHATVTGPDAAEVEAWSTALVVDPATVWPRIERTTGLEALLIDHDGLRTTSGFAAAVDWQAAPR